MENINYLIIAGTEKSGTTSVFQYLNAHPDIVGSDRKETDFFRAPPPHNLVAYASLFPSTRDGQTRMEASPGYLAESGRAAPAIAALIPHARLLFILRDPIDRLLSGFDFHKSRFHIPDEMSFDDYIALCMRYEAGQISQQDAGLKEWHLRVPDAGRYAHHLRDYMTRFQREQILVMTLDSLQRDPLMFMRDVCTWAGLNSHFYDNYDFVRANVTFTPRRAWLQKLGLRVNKGLEPFFNQHPAIKQHMLGLYKRINGQRTVKSAMTEATASRLVEYYKDDLSELIRDWGTGVAEATNWLRKHHAG